MSDDAYDFYVTKAFSILIVMCGFDSFCHTTANKIIAFVVAKLIVAAIP